MRKGFRRDKLREECGVFGIFDKDGHDVARMSYYALYALQHRGQESAGIAVNDNGTILYHKDMGLVPEVFNEVILNHLKGRIAISHVRYSTTGANSRENAQPMVIKYRNGQLALAHNGNLVNASNLREKLEEDGLIFQSTNDSEVILNLISRYSLICGKVEEAIQKMMQDVRGSYSILLLTPDKLIGIRDPLGIRPLCIGLLGNSYVLASESCALDAIGAKFIRDVKPGEIVTISEEGISSIEMDIKEESRLCIFEFIYFARPDSFLDGASVYQARLEAGRRLAIEHPVEADLVIGAPDSGITAAIGYSMESGIPYGQGLLKNRYIGRTFIQPDQEQREMGVKIKLNVMKNAIEGKRLVIIDDSIVRGTTTKRIIKALKDAGAKEVHMRVSSPPMKYPCYFGVDIPSGKQLVASISSIEEVRQLIGADSLGYLSLEGLLKTPVGAKCGFCSACFTGEYPMEVPGEGSKYLCGGKR
ncbi:amidophosphoribosyltransferase [Clostridium thermosuccinogenes]|jgi:amidophosphoribosyltransferase|uniref:Amidophosphoribosyltransferase n=1 Tax=Clostridium thermosuccinogenes TaxID=84032 RepID=A0A2K2F4W6_9CLOT|nr:amidophosphoribosyltransferase [Pseudoclostridium thermosuccinogenes]AUS97556.1 amidophosphoribosyltransferase [Pseudoclostridium thermosuccinogenes]PNT93810.1 amidophosphoribosyltransferase [Pseudoclostridium thermosuccinogenes]PNT96921.1 amidophosphoribosyltransferase [Pseudoclostridium thermosuccinogenes]PNT98804.1 amidophosphoribosyltransferase [Pseudoclostridium thermosuccinogenes]